MWCVWWKSILLPASCLVGMRWPWTLNALLPDKNDVRLFHSPLIATNNPPRKKADLSVSGGANCRTDNDEDATTRIRKNILDISQEGVLLLLLYGQNLKIGGWVSWKLCLSKLCLSSYWGHAVATSISIITKANSIYLWRIHLISEHLGNIRC